MYSNCYINLLNSDHCEKENKTTTLPVLKKGMTNITILVAVTRHYTPIMVKLKGNKERDEWRTTGNSMKN